MDGHAMRAIRGQDRSRPIREMRAVGLYRHLMRLVLQGNLGSIRNARYEYLRYRTRPNMRGLQVAELRLNQRRGRGVSEKSFWRSNHVATIGLF